MMAGGRGLLPAFVEWMRRHDTAAGVHDALVDIAARALYDLPAVPLAVTAVNPGIAKLLATSHGNRAVADMLRQLLTRPVSAFPTAVDFLKQLLLTVASGVGLPAFQCPVDVVMFVLEPGWSSGIGWGGGAVCQQVEDRLRDIIDVSSRSAATATGHAGQGGGGSARQARKAASTRNIDSDIRRCVAHAAEDAFDGSPCVSSADLLVRILTALAHAEDALLEEFGADCFAALPHDSKALSLCGHLADYGGKREALAQCLESLSPSATLGQRLAFCLPAAPHASTSSAPGAVVAAAAVPGSGTNVGMPLADVVSAIIERMHLAVEEELLAEDGDSDAAAVLHAALTEFGAT